VTFETIGWLRSSLAASVDRLGASSVLFLDEHVVGILGDRGSQHDLQRNALATMHVRGEAVRIETRRADHELPLAGCKAHQLEMAQPAADGARRAGRPGR
jgi:hypothetical protein